MLKEIMKLEYQVLQVNSTLLSEFSKNKNYLIQILKGLDSIYDSIVMEAFLLLSIFVLRPNRH